MRDEEAAGSDLKGLCLGKEIEINSKAPLSGI